MPILQAEPDLFPRHLFSSADPGPAESDGRDWYVLHTRPRQEKSVARELYRRAIPYYLPLVPRRSLLRGRVVTSYLPLFPGYVFLLGSREERGDALATGRVVRSLDVGDPAGLWRDLRRVARLLASGEAVAVEERLVPGAAVVIQSGPLAGLEGKILSAASARRFVVAVDFIQKGASVVLDECVLVRKCA
jgi:transcriptional antiterminator RfaH